MPAGYALQIAKAAPSIAPREGFASPGFFGVIEMEVPRLTKEQAAIAGAFTGITFGPFSDIHEYAERVLGRPVWTHEFASKTLSAELKEAARRDFEDMVHVEKGE